MTVWPGDALSGQDGTGGDGVGPLPGFELPVLRLPTLGPDGEIIGLDEPEDDPDADLEPEDEPSVDQPVADEAIAVAFQSTGRPPANAGRVVSTGLLAGAAEPVGAPEPDPVADLPPVPVVEPDPPDAAAPEPPPPVQPAAPTPVRDTAFSVPVPPTAVLPPRPYARPPVVDDAGILGLTRVSRSRVGSRLFTWAFVLIFTLIAVQMVVALLSG